MKDGFLARHDMAKMEDIGVIWGEPLILDWVSWNRGIVPGSMMFGVSLILY